jgi:hypothetical protein
MTPRRRGSLMKVMLESCRKSDFCLDRDQDGWD